MIIVIGHRLGRRNHAGLGDVGDEERMGAAVDGLRDVGGQVSAGVVGHQTQAVFGTDFFETVIFVGVAPRLEAEPLEDGKGSFRAQHRDAELAAGGDHVVG